MPIRQARLDDTSGICNLFVGGIERWQRMNAEGQVDDLPYAELSIYERWLHGGAWMSIETGAIWLSHLCSGAGLAFVQEENSQITGYAEAFISHEPAPYGYHLHIGELAGGNDAVRQNMLEHLIGQAGGIGRITVSSTPYDSEKLKFYRKFGFSELIQIQRVNLTAQGANAGFYKVTDHKNADSAQIQDWQMPVGRVESSRYHWEKHWSQLWDAVPQITERPLYRLHFNAGGQDAFVLVQQHLYNPRSAEVYCWTPKALQAHLIGAIRDWAYKAGYRSLNLAVNEKIAKILDSDLEKTAHQHVILSRDV